MGKGACVQMCFLLYIYYNCIIILLSVTVFVCHEKGNVFCTINSPIYVYWKQVILFVEVQHTFLYYHIIC